MKKYNFYPFDYKGDKLIKNDCAVIRHSSLGHLCGYCVIEKSNIPKEWWGNYNADGLQYLNVHGGITYCRKEGDYVVFGFDCAHSGDENIPELKNMEHVLALAQDMKRQILDYASIIDEWRTADDKKKAEMLDAIREKAKYKHEFGFGALIGIMFGNPWEANDV